MNTQPDAFTFADILKIEDVVAFHKANDVAGPEFRTKVMAEFVHKMTEVFELDSTEMADDAENLIAAFLQKHSTILQKQHGKKFDGRMSALTVLTSTLGVYAALNEIRDVYEDKEKMKNGAYTEGVRLPDTLPDQVYVKATLAASTKLIKERMNALFSCFEAIGKGVLGSFVHDFLLKGR